MTNADMVSLQHELLEKGLGVDHLRLVIGTSMGCMHSWMWGEAYPDEMDALMPLACLPVEIAGRNRMWRKMIIDGIRQDPEWKNGEYSSEPRAALRISPFFSVGRGHTCRRQENGATPVRSERLLTGPSHQPSANLQRGA
jgi:homoserine O-acetyltransferase